MRRRQEAVIATSRRSTRVRYLGDLRRQHGRRLVSLRRERVGAQGRCRASAHAPRSRTSTRSASSRRRSTYEVARQIDVIESAARSYRKPACTTPTRARHAACAPRKWRTTIATSRILTCCLWNLDAAMISRVKATLPGIAGSESGAFRRDAGASGIRRGRVDFVEGAGPRTTKRSPNYWRAAPNLSREPASNCELRRSRQTRRQLGGRFCWPPRSTSTTSSIDPKVDRSGLSRISRRASSTTPSPSKIAKDVFEAMWAEGKGRRRHHRVEGSQTDHRHGRHRESHRWSYGEESGQLADYRSGKDKLFGFFVGQVMKGPRRQGESRAAQRAAEEALPVDLVMSESDKVRRFSPRTASHSRSRSAVVAGLAESA